MRTAFKNFIIIIMIIGFTILFAVEDYRFQLNKSITWEQFLKKEQKIGLALGGGAVLGAAHIGVLKALEELDISIDYITGTSIGAFVSALYAYGMHWDEIEEIAEDLNWMDLSELSFSKMGLLSNKKMGELINEHIGDVNLEDSNIPVAMIATDIVTMEKIILKHGNVAQATMASTCIPGVFAPVEINGRLLVDGGLVENVPISPLKEMGAKLIIGVDLNTGYKNQEPENIIEVLLRTFIITLGISTKFQTQEADILIAPDLSDFNIIDIDQFSALIERGYIEAMRVLKKQFNIK